MSKVGFSVADIQQGAKRLNSVPEPRKADEKKPDSAAGDLEALEDLYEKHNGDLDLMWVMNQS